MPLSPSELLTIVAIAKKEVERVIPDLLQPEDGRDGKDGIDGKDGADGRDGRDGKDGIDGKDGKNGVNGRDGADGINARDGADGKDGNDGLDGKPGRDGVNGKDGVGIEDVSINKNGHLYVDLTNGRTIDAGRVRGRDGADGKIIAVGGGGVFGGGAGGESAQETFETVNKNLKSLSSTLTYGTDGLENVAYSNGVIKTLAYSLSGLQSVTLSGNTPNGISLVKTFEYTGGDLTAVTYS